MDIYKILYTKPHNKHYLDRYVKFIKSCLNENESITEDHHILPRAKDLFPEYKSFKKYPENKISLTLRQHYIAHFVLWKAYGGSQSQAFFLMCSRNTDKRLSRIYEKLRIERREEMTSNNPNLDGKHSKSYWANAGPERRIRQAEILRNASINRKKPKETRFYKCSYCNKSIEKIEFAHHDPKSHYYCDVICRNKRTASIRCPNAILKIPRILKLPKPPTEKKLRVAWNKGLPNPLAAQNGKKGTEKMRVIATGRKKKILPDGSWTWEYPNKGGD